LEGSIPLTYMRNQLLVATGSTLEAIKNPPKGGQNTKNVMG